MTITLINCPRKREAAFVASCDPMGKADTLTYRNMFRHFCAGRDARRAVEACRDHVAHHPHLAYMDYPGKLATALSD
jgi:hypothetical protein